MRTILREIVFQLGCVAMVLGMCILLAICRLFGIDIDD